MFTRSAAFATSLVLLLGITANVPNSLGNPAPHARAFVCPDPPDPSMFSVSVTPDGGSASWQENTTTHKAVFTIQNTGICNDTYSFSAYSSGPITVVSLSLSSALIGRGLSRVDTVTYNVGSAGSGTLTFVASGMAGDDGYYNVTVTPPPYRVSVTPHSGQTADRMTFTAYSDTFTVQNTGANQDSYSLTCIGSSGITCGPLSPAGPITLGPLGSAPQRVAVNYTTGAGGFWTLRLAAVGAYTDTGTYAVSVISYGVSVTPHDSTTLQRPAHTSGYSESFTVRNTGLSNNTYSLSCGTSANVFCTGLTRNGSNVSSVLLGPGGSATILALDSVGAVGNGRLSLRATGTNASDSGRYNIPVVTPSAQPPVVDINSLNPGTFVDRSLCLTIAAGAAGASECGDLRIVHSLPTTRTMNKPRTPTLLYNSQTAHPYPIVAVNVTLPSTAAIPDSVTGILQIANVTRARGKWLGNQWASGQTRRVALGFDALMDTTGVYAYTVEIRNWYPDPTPSQPTPVNGAVVVVNRSSSPFGAGWWIAGLERLNLSNMVWVGGDGSVRQYQLVTTNVWAGPNVDRPDTLKKVGTEYLRTLPHGVQVWFDATGKHVRTVNRLGHTTTFAYLGTTDTLISITLPPAGSGKVYQFAYVNGKLQTVTAPPIGSTTRITTLTDPAGQVTAIRDPDTYSVGFASDAGFTNRIISRTDRRGNTTFYAFDAGSKLTTDSLPLGTGQTPIVQRIRPLESFGLATAVDTAVATTRLDGPRVDVVDTTAFWLDRFGEPRRIRNALGHETILTRGDARWPALVTRVRYPNGRVDGAAYDGRGNVVEVTDSSHFEDRFVVQGGCPPCNGSFIRFYATTRYAWDAVWDFVTKIRRAEKDSIIMAYDPNGNRLWQQLGSDVGRRVNFRYNAQKLLSATVLPATAADSIEYDPTLWNLSATRTPLQYWVSHYTDQLGRDTLVVTPIDSSDHGKGTAADSTSRLRQRVVYTIMDLDSISESIAPNRVQTLQVVKYFDAEGNDTLLSRTPLGAQAQIGTVTTKWRYDLANRRVADSAPDGFKDTTVYDPAGNAIAVVTRNATFTYDVMGRLVTANNQDAKILRTYYPNGLLEWDSLRIQTLNRDNWDQHKYGIRHTYDLDGRQTQLFIPSQLGSAQLFGDISFGYDTLTGDLAWISDLNHDTYAFGHNMRGDLVSLSYPGAHEEHFAFDNDGRLIGDTILNQADTTFPRYNGQVLRADFFKYDAQGRLLWYGDPLAYKDTLTVTYSGMGHIASSQFREYRFGLAEHPDQYVSNETFAFDALGNRYSAVTNATLYYPNSTVPDNTTHTSAYKTGVGQLQTDVLNGLTTTYSYDSSGSTVFNSNPGGSLKHGEERASFYAADGMLRGADWRWVSCTTCDPNSQKYAFDEYRYDALGRRVWMRSRKSCVRVDTQNDWRSYIECVTGLMRRTVWNGDQELVEIQMPGDSVPDEIALFENDTAITRLGSLPTCFDREPYFGRVVNIPGRSIDQPLAITRINYEDSSTVDEGYHVCASHRVLPPMTVIPFWSRSGDAPLGVYSNGYQAICPSPPSTFRCVSPLWSFFSSSFDRENRMLRTDWHGSLLEGKRDKSGLAYVRNRYYDPATGRFTQEDPLGLAGGLNLYGFAAGDPVNFSDPFGLRVCFKGDARKRQELQEAAENAINADIEVDKHWCVTGVTARPGEGFESLRKEFQELVGDPSTFSAQFADGRAVSHFDPDTRTAIINPLDIQRRRYVSGSLVACFLGGSGTATFSVPAILVHELIGHGSGMVGGGKPWGAGVWAENQYHAAYRESRRCWER